MIRPALTRPAPKWAQLETEEDENRKKPRTDEPRGSDDEEELVAISALHDMTRSTGKYISAARKRRTLSQVDSTAQLCKDITVGHNLHGSVNVVKFHPAKPILLTGADNGTVSLFEICENEDTLKIKKSGFFLQDAQFRHFHIASMDFLNGGHSLFVTARNKKYSYLYDLVTGKVSQVSVPQASTSTSQLRISKVVLSADGVYVAYLIGSTDLNIFVFDTMEHLHTFRADAELVDFQFATSSRNLVYAQTVGGVIYAWDLLQRGEQSRFFDDGCVRATCLALSANEQFLSCGSNTGIVNVYETSSLWTSGEGRAEELSKKPLYTLGNLTTSVTFLRFNHDAQLMTFGSDVKTMAGRLLHCRSGSVYANFPARQEMLTRDRFLSCAFSPHSAFFAFGMQSGACRFYRLNHYEEY